LFPVLKNNDLWECRLPWLFLCCPLILANVSAQCVRKNELGNEEPLPVPLDLDSIRASHCDKHLAMRKNKDTDYQLRVGIATQNQ
jgi:hypothetical protein